MARKRKGEQTPKKNGKPSPKSFEKRLHRAINDAVKGSKLVRRILHEIRDVGFSVDISVISDVVVRGENYRLEWTPQDEKFLKALKISIEEEPESQD